MKSTKKANYAKSQCHCHCQLRSITCILWQTKLTSRSLVLLRFDLRFGEFVFLFGWIDIIIIKYIKKGLLQALFYFIFIVDIYNNIFFALKKNNIDSSKNSTEKKMYAREVCWISRVSFFLKKSFGYLRPFAGFLGYDISCLKLLEVERLFLKWYLVQTVLLSVWRQAARWL